MRHIPICVLATFNMTLPTMMAISLAFTFPASKHTGHRHNWLGVLTMRA
jgi:hypothetical protein